jgi:branched-chain amino acid transport system substrate-binding protein
MRTRILFVLALVAVMVLPACCPPVATPEPTKETAVEPTKETAAEPTKETAAEPTEAPPAEEYECTDEWGCATFAPGEKIKLGYVGPMTGDYAAFGTDISRGVELAVKYHGPVMGFEIEVVIEDTQGSPEQGAAVANKFAADPMIVAVVGHTFSGSTEVAIPIYQDAGIVMMSPSATNPSLVEIGSDVFNRVAFTDQMQGEFAANYIYNTLGVTKIAVMHDGGAYGQGLAEIAAAAFEALGGEVVASEAITPGETDYSAPLAAIAASEPELIYYGGYDADAAVLVSQMAAAGLGDAMFFGCDGTYGVKYIELAGDASEGTFSTYVPIPESDAFTKFQEDYLADYGEEQGTLSPFSPHGHDSAAVLLAAMDEVAVMDGDNLVIPRKALADAVRGTTSFEGLTGTITCSAEGECAAAAILFMKVVDGEWVPGPGQE